MSFNVSNSVLIIIGLIYKDEMTILLFCNTNNEVITFLTLQLLMLTILIKKAFLDIYNFVS